MNTRARLESARRLSLELVRHGFDDLTGDAYEELRDGLKERIRASSIPIRLVEISDEAIDFLLTIAREELIHNGGHCTYEWHKTLFTPAGMHPEACEFCDLPKRAHEMRLACPELPKVGESEP